jgi:microcystin-dependent protein
MTVHAPDSLTRISRPPMNAPTHPSVCRLFTVHRPPIIALVAVVLSFLFRLSSFAAEAPLYIPFQGQVTNQAGTVVADGQYSVIFNLYDQAVGGQPVWSERHVRVGVTRGMVNVFLGSISSLASVDFSEAKYLGITVDTDNLATTADPEMVPRSVIIPAFHAKKAEVAENAVALAGQTWSAFMVNSGGAAVNDPATGYLNGARLLANSVGSGQISNGAVGVNQLGNSAVTLDKLAQAVKNELVPAGTIHAYGGSTAPSGYLVCDGAVLDRATYPALFAAIGTNFGSPSGTTFNLPDLRGQFLRGVMPNLSMTGSGNASGNAVTTSGNHPFSRTGMRVRVSGTLVSGLAANTDYYIVNVSVNSVAFATTPENARTGTRITISGGASGMTIAQAEDLDVMGRLRMFPGGAENANPGSVQRDELVSHNHTITKFSSGGDTTNRLIGGTSNNSTGNQDHRYDMGLTGGSETRPKNVYVNFIIKY